MKTDKGLGRRILAVLGIAALSLMGTAVANAEPTPAPTTGAGNIDPAVATSLTIHKYDGNPGQAGDGTVIDAKGLGNALKGVEFTITPVTTKGGAAIDLTTEAGWNLIGGAKVADVTTPNGYAFGTAVKATTGDDGSVKTALPKGLYLVTETGYGANTITTPAEPFLVTLPLAQSKGSWLYDVHVYPKNKVSTDVPTKTVSNPTDGVVVGSKVPWTITAPVQPTAPGAITSFVVTDDLDARLGFVSAVASGFEAGDYSVTTAGQKVTLTFTEAGLAKLKAGDVVTIELITTVNSLGDGVIPNKAIVFTNDNGGKTTSKPGEPGVDPKTNWGPLKVLKHAAGDEAKVLAGATFAVYSDAAATTKVGEFTTGADGVGSIVLWVGNDDDSTQDYWLKETAAPAGYVLDATTVHKVTVTAGNDASAVVLKVANTQQDHPTLPLTGAAGQIAMTAGGASLILIAGVAALAAARRRRQNA